MVMVPTPHSASGIWLASAAGTCHWYTAFAAVWLTCVSEVPLSVPELLPKV